MISRKANTYSDWGLLTADTLFLVNGLTKMLFALELFDKWINRKSYILKLTVQFPWRSSNEQIRCLSVCVRCSLLIRALYKQRIDIGECIHIQKKDRDWEKERDIRFAQRSNKRRHLVYFKNVCWYYTFIHLLSWSETVTPMIYWCWHNEDLDTLFEGLHWYQKVVIANLWRIGKAHKFQVTYSMSTIL